MSDTEKLKGRDDADFHAQQKALLGANLQLLNVRDTLVRLKGEIDVGLGKIDLAIINVEKSGFGLGVRDSFVPQISVQKGKEKVGLEGQPNAYLHNKKGKKLLKYGRRKPGWAAGASGPLKGILGSSPALEQPLPGNQIPLILGSLPEKDQLLLAVAGQSSSPELLSLSSAHSQSTQPSPEVEKAPEELLGVLPVSTPVPEAKRQILPELAAFSSKVAA